MKEIIQSILATYAFLAAATIAAAESPATEATSNQAERGTGFVIPWYSIDSGGTMFAAGGDWALAGTIGQFDATKVEALAGSGWQLTGGFWAARFDQALREPVIFSDRFEE